MQPMNLGNIIFFAYSDGTVEYRQRTDFLQPFLNDDLDKVWHLAQIGFSYTEDEPCKIHKTLFVCTADIFKACRLLSRQVIVL